MTLKMYSIRDAKSEIFNKPWFAITHGEAERNFTAAVNDEKTSLHNHPEDFDLFYVGMYDDNTGKLTALQTPEHIIKAVQVKKSAPQNVVQL